MINRWDDLGVKKVGAPALSLARRSRRQYLHVDKSILDSTDQLFKRFTIYDSFIPERSFCILAFRKKKHQNQEQSVIGKGVFVWIINLGDSQLY